MTNERKASEVHQPTAEERVSTLIGDRLCDRCGYNLIGQFVIREPHYNMLIVRCPECGTVASIQEYPLLGRWATRWGVVLAALWFVLLLALLFCPPIAIVGGAYAIADESIDPLVDQIGARQAAWAIENGRDVPQRPSWGGVRRDRQYSRYTPIITDWWDQQNHAVLLRECGGLIRNVDWGVLRQWVLVLIPFAAYGFVWSLCLPHVRRRWFPLVVLAIGGVCFTYWLVGASMVTAWGPTDLEDAAYLLIGRPTALMMIGMGLIPVLIGMMLGRSLARLIVRALLPPRLRGSLAMLWTVDGLSQPRRTVKSRPN